MALARGAGMEALSEAVLQAPFPATEPASFAAGGLRLRPRLEWEGFTGRHRP
jgi:hypothetical protein